MGGGNSQYPPGFLQTQSTDQWYPLNKINIQHPSSSAPFGYLTILQTPFQLCIYIDVVFRNAFRITAFSKIALIISILLISRFFFFFYV